MCIVSFNVSGLASLHLPMYISGYTGRMSDCLTMVMRYHIYYPPEVRRGKYWELREFLLQSPFLSIMKKNRH